jgi:hypothetical protein
MSRASLAELEAVATVARAGGFRAAARVTRAAGRKTLEVDRDAGDHGGVWSIGWVTPVGRWNKLWASERTWMSYVTACFRCELIARWLGPIRHQAVLLTPVCDPQNQFVLDAYYFLSFLPGNSELMFTYSEWVESTTAGLVSKGF